MNRLSIVLVIAFVSYSLGAPENIESHSAHINHDLEHSGDHELEKQNGYGDGNVNNDPSASENPIHDFGCGNSKRKAYCRNYCRNYCVSGTERCKCSQCINACLRRN
ncbi:uncharacterized protein LOC132946481 isoform X2 [Metopolophium dirhodum]|uniref:uncharacterized protein LOC132946481 isoform X2 n=1 Tax=Metopolophium dirhodum TaxID=44670 RepID=UPI00298F5271|nr:uncharacterized protein LOC132946481 isoform X2 [Metopolophium dirhodum]